MYTQKQFGVVMCLYQNGRVDELKNYKRATIAKITNLHVNTVISAIKEFMELGYIKEGAKDGISKTYYLTKEGIEIYQKCIGIE